MTEQEIWDKLNEVHLALCETFNAKFGKSKDVRLCLAKNGRDQSDVGCERVDCATCDALSTMRELIG